MDDTSGKGATDPIDTRLVRRLAAILKDTGLSEIEIEKGDLKIRVVREIIAAPASLTYASAPAAPPAYMQADPGAPPAAKPPPAEQRGEPVKSPMVGTVYLQAQPGDAPFIKVGDRVTEGQTLLIIEAMKTMNPIPAPRDGVVLEILAGDSEPVEFGEPLIILE